MERPWSIFPLPVPVDLLQELGVVLKPRQRRLAQCLGAVGVAVRASPRISEHEKSYDRQVIPTPTAAPSFDKDFEPSRNGRFFEQVIESPIDFLDGSGIGEGLAGARS